METYQIVLAALFVVIVGIYDVVQSRKAFKKVQLKNKLLMQELQAVERQNSTKASYEMEC